jgi:hypothetical protein
MTVKQPAVSLRTVLTIFGVGRKSWSASKFALSYRIAQLSLPLRWLQRSQLDPLKRSIEVSGFHVMTRIPRPDVHWREASMVIGAH